MMTLEDYAYLAEIVGVILIIASLIYVARQVQQNTELLRSSSRQALLSNDHEAVQISMDNVELLEKLTKPESSHFKISGGSAVSGSWICAIASTNTFSTRRGSSMRKLGSPTARSCASRWALSVAGNGGNL